MGHVESSRGVAKVAVGGDGEDGVEVFEGEVGSIHSKIGLKWLERFNGRIIDPGLLLPVEVRVWTRRRLTVWAKARNCRTGAMT